MPSPLFPNWNRKNQNQGTPQGQPPKKPSPGGVSRMGSWLKGKISAEVMKRIGPIGKLVDALLRPQGKSLAGSVEQEIEAARMIQQALAESTAERVSGSQIPPARPAYQVGSNPPPDDDDYRVFPADQPVLEGMIEVKSSNVHSIGYLHPGTHSGNGDLLVRYLGGEGKNRHGPGAMYRYRNVPIEVWRSFKIASSSGKFVWDELRVRGTVSGHQYSYDLEELGNLSRVPRQAGIKRGKLGEWYMTRTFRGRRSTLPERQVRGPRGDLPGYDGKPPTLRHGTGRR